MSKMINHHLKTNKNVGSIFVITLFVFGAVILLGFLPQQVRAAPGAPTVISPTIGFSTSETKPLIKGLTMNNTAVAVYVDGQFNGKAIVKNGSSTTASFAYYPFLNLKPGIHTLQTRAEDLVTETRSEPSSLINFEIVPPYPTPTLFEPVVNANTTYKKPLIVGIAKNDSLIKIFIDDQFNGEFWVENNESGVTDFVYQPFLDLAMNKSHTVYAVAADQNGKQSEPSARVIFEITKPYYNQTDASTLVEPKTTELDVDSSKEEIITEENSAGEIQEDTELGEEVTADTVTSTETAEENDTSREEIMDNQEEANQESINNNEEGNKATTTTQEGNENTNQETESEETAVSEENYTMVMWLIIILVVLIIIYSQRRSLAKYFKIFFKEEGMGGLRDKTSCPAEPKKEVSDVEIITPLSDLNQEQKKAEQSSEPKIIESTPQQRMDFKKYKHSSDVPPPPDVPPPESRSDDDKMPPPPPPASY